MLTIKTNLANRSNYGKARDFASLADRHLVIHYTGNDGDSAAANASYFGRKVVYTSAHYFVDSTCAIQSVPDNNVAWHCGGAAKHPKCRNENSIGIEICDEDRNGILYPNALTIANAIELAQMLMDKYDIPKSNVIRHYDVTGKSCPAYWVDDAKWKTEFWDRLNEPNTKAVYTVTATGQFNTLEAALRAVDYIESVGLKGIVDTKQEAPVPSVTIPPQNDKTIEEVARDVIALKYGRGAERKRLLLEAGYDYNEVQSMVNKILGYA